MEKLLNALRETLAKLGLDESAIDAALKEAVAMAESTEEDQQSGDPASEPTEVEVPPTEAPVEEGKEEEGEVAPSSEPETVEVPPTEEVPPVAPEGEVPPAEPVAPAFDPTDLIGMVTDLQGKLDEQLKANQGLVARIDALEEALKAAKVIDDGNPVTEIGDPNPSAAPQNPTSDVLGDVMAKLNGNKRF